MNEIDRLVLLAQENTVMKIQIAIDDVLNLELERLRAEIKKLEADRDN